MTFNKNISGKSYVATNAYAGIYMQNADGSFGGWAASTEDFYYQKEVVTLTGWQTLSTRGNTMSQLVSGKWIDLTDGWQATGEQLRYSSEAAQKYVNEIIKNNKIILCNNLFCARFSHHITDTQRQTLYDLQTRLEQRNQSLLNDGMVTDVEISSPLGYAEFEDCLQDFMQKGVGVVLTTGAVIAVSAVVLVSLATAAYFCYKAYAAEAASDVKYSDELTRTLMQKLTDEEYAQLMEETKGMVTKASLKSRLGTGLTVAKAALWGIALLAVGWIIKQTQE